MRKFLRDPLFHFLLAGGILFLISGLSVDEPSEQRIVIDAAQVRQLSKTAAVMRGQDLDRDELEALIEPVIRDEVYYREALALGLDEDDDSVRTRLIEKMRYLTEDLADPEPASDSELREFFDSNPDLFRIPEMITFDQVFFSPGQRGDELSADVSEALELLRAGDDRDGLGDNTPLRDRFENAPRDQVAVLFGEAMADALYTMSAGEWQGPYESDFGLHLVRLIARTEARQPGFEDVEQTVRDLYARSLREERNQAAYREMRGRYQVVVEWPDEESEQ